MPCPDQASLLKLKIGGDDRIMDYTYAKYTCGKPVGLGSGLKELLVERPAKTVLSLTPAEAVKPSGKWQHASRRSMRIEDEYTDALQNIESVVAAVYRDHPETTDYNVMRTYEALIDLYLAERADRPPRPSLHANGAASYACVMRVLIHRISARRWVVAASTKPAGILGHTLSECPTASIPQACPAWVSRRV